MPNPPAIDSEDNTCETELLKNILPLIENVIYDPNNISNTVITDISAEEIGNTLDLLMETSNEEMDKPLILIEAPIKNNLLLEKICSHISINSDVAIDKEVKIYLLRNHDFDVTIIPIDLEDNRVVLFIQSMKKRPQFIFEFWDNIVGGLDRPLDIRNLFNVSVTIKS